MADNPNDPKQKPKAEANGPAPNSAEADKAGYCRPPKRFQFKKGQSGNPRGRPKNQEVLETDLEMRGRILNEKVEITENGRRRIITKREVIARQFVQKAMNGDAKSAKLIGMGEMDTDKIVDELKKHIPSGLLVVEAGLSREEWLKRVYENQRKFREKLPGPIQDKFYPEKKQ